MDSPTQALNIEQPDPLLAYLCRTGRIGDDASPEMRPLTGGVSNRTVWVEQERGPAWVIKQALPKLRVETDWFSDPNRIHREAAALRWFSRILPAGAVPTMLFEDHDQHLLCMTAVPHPHENWKTMLLAGDVDLKLVTRFAELLATIHRSGTERREAASGEFADRSFFESLRLEPYYAYTAEKIPAARSFLIGLIDETRKHRYTIVHGDYSPKNVLVHQGNLVLLDHEVVHFGDGTFDVGFSLTHLLSKAHYLPTHRQTFHEAARTYWDTYSERIRDIEPAETFEPRAVRQTLGCLLARVAGRSPLEYFSVEHRVQQRDLVLALMIDPPKTVRDLIDRFVERI